MPESATAFFDWIATVPVVWAYVGILVIAWGENVVPPIPGDMAVVFGGYLVGLGRLDFLPVVLLATLGGTLGFMTLYAVGVRVGEAVLDSYRWRWLPKKQIFRVRNWLLKHGYWVIAANRFLSGARSVISVTVGIARMSVPITTALSALSAAVWCTLMVYAGYVLGDNWQQIAEILRLYARIWVAILVLGLFVWYMLWISRRQKEQRDKRQTRRGH